MENYQIESFINFCDNYQIANESFDRIKSNLISLFSKLVLWIESKVKTINNKKVQIKLLALLNKAKVGLARSKSLNEYNPEMVNKLQEESDYISKEVNEIIKSGEEIDDKNVSFIEIINNLLNKIAYEKLSVNDTKKAISLIKKKYGNDIFPGFYFKKKPRSEWTKDYAKELYTMSITGACSEEFIIYFAEVINYVKFKII